MIVILRRIVTNFVGTTAFWWLYVMAFKSIFQSLLSPFKQNGIDVSLVLFSLLLAIATIFVINKACGRIKDRTIFSEVWFNTLLIGISVLLLIALKYLTYDRL